MRGRRSALTGVLGALLWVAAAPHARAEDAAEGEALRARCPPLAFVARHHFKSPFGIGTMIAWDIAAPGGGIYALDPASGAVREIFRRDDGVVFDLSVAFDARTLLFSWRACDGEDSYHLYRIGADGTGLRQLTRGRFHDTHPIELPGGAIAFVSTRTEAFSMCQPAPTSALFVMNADGGDVRRIEWSVLSEHSPWVLDDGRILYTRWEYQDKSLYTLQALWTINPDGSDVRLFYGNTVTIPNTKWQAKPVPGSGKFLCTLAPHHGLPVGAVGMLDRDLGIENPRALRNLTPEIAFVPGNAADYAPGDLQIPWAYADPFPLAPDLFVVACGTAVEGAPQRYRLVLMDDRGRKAPLFAHDTLSCFNPVPLVPRAEPHRRPSVFAREDAEGAFIVADVYRGLPGLPRGAVKALRIMSAVPKPCNMRGQRSPYDMDPLIGRGTFFVKECFGTVPVLPDGSAYFTAPARREVYFSALDADGKELRRMGSVTQLMPGETQACIGCHEPRSTAPPVRPVEALRAPPAAITPPPWGAGPVDFVAHVQPVFDAHCVACHGGPTPKGGLDLSGDKTRFFNMAYDTCLERGLVNYQWLQNAPSGNFEVLATGARVSALTELLEQGHGGVTVGDEARRRIYTWIEANVPYYPSYEHTRPGTSGSRDAWAGPWYAACEQTFKSLGCAACHPQPPNSTGPGGRQWNWREAMPPQWINLTHPAWSLLLTAPLAPEAGGLGLCRPKNGAKPVRFAGVRDPGYAALLRAIEEGARNLAELPRIDMPGARPIAYARDFGRMYEGFAGPGDTGSRAFGPYRASHVCAWDSLAHLADAAPPASSAEKPAHTFFPHLGTTEWLEYRFRTPASVARVEVYWYADTPANRCETPARWRLSYLDGAVWRPVAAQGAYEIAKDKLNVVTFQAVTTAALRIDLELRPALSAGVLRWRVAGL